MGAAVATGTLPACGWQMEFVQGTSDKFYRFVVVDRFFIATYGRNGTSGNTYTKGFATTEGAIAEASAMTRKRERSGYSVTVDFTEFTVPDLRVGDTWNDPDALVARAFTQAQRGGAL